MITVPHFVENEESNKEISFMLWLIELIKYTFDGVGNYYIFDSENTNKYILKKDKIIMQNKESKNEITNNYSFENGYLIIQNKKYKIATKFYLIKNNY